MTSRSKPRAWGDWVGVAEKEPSAAPGAVQDLALADHLMLSGFRLSVAALQTRAERPAILEAHYTHQGVGAAAPGVFNLLRIIGGLARRPVAIGCVYCTAVSRDELLLMNAMSALQADKIARASLILADWLPIEGVEMAIPPAKAAARNFALGGLFLTPAFDVTQ